MANAITAPATSPALVALGNKALIAAHAAIKKIGQFATDFSSDAAQIGSTLAVPVISCAAANAFNASSNNYGTGVGSISFASVSFTHYVTSFNFTDAQLAEVPEALFNRCGEAGGVACGLSLVSAVCSAIKTGSLTGTGLTVPHDGTISKANVATLAGGCITDSTRAVLALNKSYYASVLALFDAAVYGGAEAVRAGTLDGGALGFKSIIQLDDAMPASTIGLVIPENAVVAASRTVPVASAAAYDDVGTVADPESGFTFGLRRFCNAATGSNSIAVEALVGAAVAQGAKIQKVTVALS